MFFFVFFCNLIIYTSHLLSILITDCEDSSHTANAEAQEPPGLRRDLDTGNEFICDNGYKMEGKPFAVSQSPGEWKLLFHYPPAKGKFNINMQKK